MIRNAIFILIFPILFSIKASAHPWGGLVIDQDGNIYFTFICPVVDDDHYACIRQLDSDANLSEVLKSGRSPSDIILARSKSRNIFAAERSGSSPSYRNTLWSINGQKHHIIEGPSSDQEVFHVQALAVSDLGEVYFAKDDRLYIRRIGKKVTQIETEYTFERIDDLAWSSDGSLYILDQSELVKMDSAGIVSSVAKNLKMDNPPNVPFSGANILFDLTVDEKGNVYLAYFGNRSILKVDPSGSVETILESESNWTPHGIDYYDGELYILESTVGGSWWKFWESNEIVPRVRKIKSDGSVETIYSYK